MTTLLVAMMQAAPGANNLHIQVVGSPAPISVAFKKDRDDFLVIAASHPLASRSPYCWLPDSAEARSGGDPLDWGAKVESFERIRREYEFVGTIVGVAEKLGVHRRMVREANRKRDAETRRETDPPGANPS